MRRDYTLYKHKQSALVNGINPILQYIGSTSSRLSHRRWDFGAFGDGSVDPTTDMLDKFLILFPVSHITILCIALGTARLHPRLFPIQAPFRHLDGIIPVSRL